MRFDISMNNPMFVQIIYRAHYLGNNSFSLFLTVVGLSFMELIIQGSIFYELSHNGKIWGSTRNSYEQDNGWMSEFGQHIYLITKLLKQFFTDFRVEDFLDSNFQTFVLPPMDGTEAAHRYLFIYLQILKVNLENRIHIKTE